MLCARIDVKALFIIHARYHLFQQVYLVTYLLVHGVRWHVNESQSPREHGIQVVRFV